MYQQFNSQSASEDLIFHAELYDPSDFIYHMYQQFNSQSASGDLIFHAELYDPSDFIYHMYQQFNSQSASGDLGENISIDLPELTWNQRLYKVQEKISAKIVIANSVKVHLTSVSYDDCYGEFLLLH